LIDAGGITAKGGSMELFWDVAYERYLRQFLHELSHVCDTVYRNKLRLFQGELGAYLVSDSPNDKIFTNAIGSTLFHSQ